MGAAIQNRVRHEQASDLATLIELAVGGDIEAFHALYERYHRRVHVYAYVRLGSTEEAQDVVQDVFLAIWRQLPRFENRHDDAFPAWLFRIAHNVVTDRLRRAARGRSVPLEVVAGGPEARSDGGPLFRTVPRGGGGSAPGPSRAPARGLDPALRP